MKQILEYKWSIIALGGLLAGLLLSRGGLASLMPLAKFLLPAVLVFFVFKVATKKLRTVASDFVTKNMNQMNQTGGFGNLGNQQAKNVIDLCPKCGSYKKAGHTC